MPVYLVRFKVTVEVVKIVNNTAANAAERNLEKAINAIFLQEAFRTIDVLSGLDGVAPAALLSLHVIFPLRSSGLHSRQSQKNTVQAHKKQKAPFGAFVVFVFCFAIWLLFDFTYFFATTKLVLPKIFSCPFFTFFLMK